MIPYFLTVTCRCRRAERWQIESIFTRAHQAALAAEAQKNPATESGRWYSVGDDRDFSYQELIAKPNLKGRVIEAWRTVPLTGNGDIDSAALIEIVLKQCDSIKTNAPLPTYFVSVDDIGKNVEITAPSIRHGFIKGKNRNGISAPVRSLNNARVCLDLPQILKNSIEVNRSHRTGNNEVKFSHILLGVTAMEETDGTIGYYAVRSIVEARKNQGAILTEAGIVGRLYAVNAKKIEMPRAQVGLKAVALTHSSLFEYSVSDLLEDVKLKFGDTFSEDVYNHLGQTRRITPFSDNLRYSIPDEDVPSASARRLSCLSPRERWHDEVVTERALIHRTIQHHHCRARIHPRRMKTERINPFLTRHPLANRMDVARFNCTFNAAEGSRLFVQVKTADSSTPRPKNVTP